MLNRFYKTQRKNSNYLAVYNTLKPERDQIIQHPLYKNLTTLQHLCLFTESHVYAVWDFMTLLKALQNNITCTAIPWKPSPHPELARLINDIVLNEESDEIEAGLISSHCEYYLNAMQQMGANTKSIEKLIALLKNGIEMPAIVSMSYWPLHVLQFLQTTWSIASHGKPHEIAAAFTFGREELIPDMFTNIVHALHAREPDKLYKFKRYLERHIELDGDEHGPMAIVLLETLCGNNEDAWEECYIAGRRALQARKILWDGILECCQKLSDTQVFGQRTA